MEHVGLATDLAVFYIGLFAAGRRIDAGFIPLAAPGTLKTGLHGLYGNGPGVDASNNAIKTGAPEARQSRNSGARFSPKGWATNIILRTENPLKGWAPCRPQRIWCGICRDDCERRAAAMQR